MAYKNRYRVFFLQQHLDASKKFNTIWSRLSQITEQKAIYHFVEKSRQDYDEFYKNSQRPQLDAIVESLRIGYKKSDLGKEILTSGRDIEGLNETFNAVAKQMWKDKKPNKASLDKFMQSAEQINQYLTEYLKLLATFEKELGNLSEARFIEKVSGSKVKYSNGIGGETVETDIEKLASEMYENVKKGMSDSKIVGVKPIDFKPVFDDCNKAIQRFQEAQKALNSGSTPNYISLAGVLNQIVGHLNSAGGGLREIIASKAAEKALKGLNYEIGQSIEGSKYIQFHNKLVDETTAKRSKGDISLIISDAGVTINVSVKAHKHIDKPAKPHFNYIKLISNGLWKDALNSYGVNNDELITLANAAAYHRKKIGDTKDQGEQNIERYNTVKNIIGYMGIYWAFTGAWNDTQGKALFILVNNNFEPIYKIFEKMNAINKNEVVEWFHYTQSKNEFQNTWVGDEKEVSDEDAEQREQLVIDELLNQQLAKIKWNHLRYFS